MLQVYKLMLQFRKEGGFINIRDLQQFITDHFYTCTPEILAGLGQMYAADDRFRKNIDMAGGEGTADFVAQAIAAYCGK